MEGMSQHKLTNGPGGKSATRAKKKQDSEDRGKEKQEIREQLIKD